ncbi:MAG: GDP-mannose 4,6-dehydratase, partial [Candidatus Sulfotelmatobacter sp.]
KYVKQHRENFRSPETSLLVGDPAKAKHNLGWSPTIAFEELVTMMVDADLLLLKMNSEQESSPARLDAPAATEDTPDSRR